MYTQIKSKFEGSTRELDNWKDFYLDAAEAHPREKLEPMGEPVTVRVCIYAKHPGSLANSRSHSGILIFVNNSLIKFYRFLFGVCGIKNGH